jgi:predicted MFS family arabinose efflux permease
MRMTPVQTGMQPRGGGRMTSEPVELARAAAEPPGAAAVADAEAAAFRRASPLIWALMAVFALNIVDRQMIGLLGHLLSKDLHLSDSQIGLLGGLGFAAAYAAASIPWGWIADLPKIGRMAALSAALAIWSAATAAGAGAQNFMHILLARMGVAAGEAGCLPAAHALIAEAVPRARLARAMAIFGLGVPIGAFVGKAGGGLLSDMFGWRSAFFMVGAPGVILAVVLLIVFRNPPRLTIRPAQKPTVRKALAEIFRSQTIIYNMLGNVFTSALSAMIGFWGMFHFQRNLGLTAGETGWWLGLQAGGTGIVGVILGGWIADKLAQQRPAHYMSPAVVGQLIAPVMLVFAWWTDLWWLALLLTIFPTMCDNLAYAGPAAATQRLLTSDVRATAGSIIGLVVTLAGPGLGLTLFGVVSDMVRDHLPPGANPYESVRYVLMGSAFLFVLPAWFFWMAGRKIEGDLARFEAAEAQA